LKEAQIGIQEGGSSAMGKSDRNGSDTKREGPSSLPRKGKVLAAGSTGRVLMLFFILVTVGAQKEIFFLGKRGRASGEGVR